jgi:hypothetical protein
MKKNSFSLDIDVRNQRTNQLTGDDKVARISDGENFALNVYQADYAIKEFFGPRADDDVQKTELYKQIAMQGYCQLQDLTDDVKNKHTLNTVDVFFTGAGIMTDLVTEGLATVRSTDLERRRKSNLERTGNE